MSGRQKLLIAVNSIIVINVIAIAAMGIARGAGEGQVGTFIIGLGYLKPYTMDSNILAGLLAAAVLAFSVKNRQKAGGRIPLWLMRAYLMAATCLTLTFLIAAAFLAPVRAMAGGNYFTLFSGDMFFFHFLNPLLAVLSFVLLLEDGRAVPADRLLGMLPTIVYSVVYFVMVVVLKRWNDFYHFTFGGRYYLIPAVVAVIYGAAYMISYLLCRLHNRFACPSGER